MDGVKEWAAALCVAAIGCALLQMLAPKEGMGRLFRILIAAFFLCCLVTPLLSICKISSLTVDWLPDEVQSEMLQEEVNNQLEEQINAALMRVAKEKLAAYDIQVEKIAAITDTSETGSIYIERVVLYLDEKNQANSITARQVMEQELGLTVDIKTTA